ncbi:MULTISPECIES: helix-turn-helix domain-containing protein [Streptomyces]|jgi:hypothetical protein|uniref:Uncharacterized protein n=2 Tax=Streptomyces TaxID=1883 RepID=A0AA40SBD7_9ACTN|nr:MULTISPECIES: hypothetical protein [Streptomyces]MBA8943193.1 hypothetical protein [Streptomyces calvus]MBA8978886.1 hypothetical protein [Streptomyces calvus]MYS28052.1 hypothetical protein [Streptomyces sp. SID7804]GGP35806.1 hypothetical protein GCM10010247_04660 [Streptomyces calvus]
MANGSTLESSDSLKAFGAALKAFRERALLTQEQLAERLSGPAAVSRGDGWADAAS